ncbi:kinase-like domain-containing protein [Suillus clintonianus]|uniref:kinase-like domain-containing protein n=1 Tax=Suillus clintonianus TaxID=1904413 RepID=UPI001B86BE26|nr:kinase-like domain-containing protein [Suillus clintonianus]KAG2125384.1 kinase-like domain-containing protein [Suillus clintonianus]
MNKVPVRVDGRFRLGEVLGSGSYAVVYSARNIINDDNVALKLETVVNHSSSVEREYWILKQLEGGVGIPRTLWFGRESAYHALVLELLGPSLHQLFLANNRRFSLLNVVNLGVQLLSRLEYIHSHNYVHGDIKPQNILVGLGNLRHTAFIIDFGITKMYWNTATSDHVPFRHGRSLSGTPAFASINNHLGVEPGRRDDLESLTYMLIYFLRGSLPWLTSDDEKLSNSTILERKARATIADICHDIPVEFANILIYTRSLAFAEDPDYDHLRSLLNGLRATLPAPATCMLDFSQPDGPAIPPLLSPDGPSIPPPLSPDQCCVAKAISPCPPKVVRRSNSCVTPAEWLHMVCCVNSTAEIATGY